MLIAISLGISFMNNELDNKLNILILTETVSLLYSCYFYISVLTNKFHFH